MPRAPGTIKQKHDEDPVDPETGESLRDEFPDPAAGARPRRRIPDPIEPPVSRRGRDPEEDEDEDEDEDEPVTRRPAKRRAEPDEDRIEDEDEDDGMAEKLRRELAKARRESLDHAGRVAIVRKKYEKVAKERDGLLEKVDALSQENAVLKRNNAAYRSREEERKVSTEQRSAAGTAGNVKKKKLAKRRADYKAGKKGKEVTNGKGEEEAQEG